jgi:hypothetical protein
MAVVEAVDFNVVAVVGVVVGVVAVAEGAVAEGVGFRKTKLLQRQESPRRGLRTIELKNGAVVVDIGRGVTSPMSRKTAPLNGMPVVVLHMLRMRLVLPLRHLQETTPLLHKELSPDPTLVGSLGLSITRWIFRKPVLRMARVEDERLVTMVYKGLPCPEGDRAQSHFVSAMARFLFTLWGILCSWGYAVYPLDDSRRIPHSDILYGFWFTCAHKMGRTESRYSHTLFSFQTAGKEET